MKSNMQQIAEHCEITHMQITADQQLIACDLLMNRQEMKRQA